MSLHRTVRLAPVLALLVAACGDEPDAAVTASDVTSVDDTAVKAQTIANCWLYATAAWSESLHLAATREAVDISEGYWTFWYWFEEIVGSDLALRELDVSEPIVEGGWWGIAAEIATRYGWMSEQEFRPAGEGLSKATWHHDAVEAMNASLQTGLLSDTWNRGDRILVFDELVRIWGLDPAVADDMRSIFGKGVTHDLRGFTYLGSSRVRSLEALASYSHDGLRITTQDQIYGTIDPAATPAEGRRIGAEAWSEIRYQWLAGTDDVRRRDMLRNVQDTMHKRMAVPVAWAVSSAQEGVYSGAQYWISGLHESVLVDYEVEEVPGFGTLPLGTAITNPAALEAALDPAARVTRFRLKNSWGADPYYSEEEWRQFGYGGPPPTTPKESYLPSKPGYNDVTMDYFDSSASGVESWYGANSHFMLAVAMPNDLRFPVPQPALKRVFVSFEEYRASDFPYIGGPDAVCNDLAQKAEAIGTYRAFVTGDGSDPKLRFTPDGNAYRALHLKRGSLRATPMVFGDHPKVTQDGVDSEKAYWIGWAGDHQDAACVTDGTIRDAAGTDTVVSCNSRHALVCVQQ
jgi:hypothetical protein